MQKNEENIWHPSYLASLVKDIPDFPKPGILFKDIMPILSSHIAFASLIHQFRKVMPHHVEKIVAIESRGFLIGSALAAVLGLGIVPVRKKGKLPGPVHSYSYELEYGMDTLELQQDALKPGEKVVVIDDVLATGGTARATEFLLRKADVELQGHVFFLEIEVLGGRNKLSAPVTSILRT